MSPVRVPIWKKAPFIRLLIPFIAGILLQWFFQFTWQQISFFGLASFFLLVFFRLLPLSLRFKLQSLQGLIINLIVLGLGFFITYQKDIRDDQNWFGNFYHNKDYLIVTINEPLSEKPKSFKAESIVNDVINNDSSKSCIGKLLIYFEKDTLASRLKYGNKILIGRSLQSIKNSGNPGAFNYQRYSAFQQIFHQVYLRKKDWILLPEKNTNAFMEFIYDTRENILQILQKYIKGENELGIAEALLIGYKADLDTDLVQAYSNTGVVHIIAISGLHLGLIYFMLLWIFDRIRFLRRSKITKAVIILASLWLFALLTGGSASVLRSAVMFTCIIAGNSFDKKSSIYNSLAASAFLLLCYNPYFVWDVGFQLSYLAVVGIVVFQKPIYNWIYIKNKWIDKVWQLMAVSLAAQIFTFPICIYYFHQFPNLFLISNLVAVPLSSIILFAEIFLIAFAAIPYLDIYLGQLTSWLIWFMNEFIVSINNLPYAVFDGIAVTILSTALLYSFVFCLGAWLLNKNKKAFTLSLFVLLSFMILQAYTKWHVAGQQKLIIYNVPQHQAIDFVSGNNCKFFGDSILLQDGMLQNFHIKPGRIAMHIHKRMEALDQLFQNGHFFQFNNKKILVLDSSVNFEPPQKRIDIDAIVVSKNARLYIPQLAQVFNCKQYIFDASNPLWKIEKWEKDCERLHLPFHSVPEKGAFIMDL